MKKRKVVVSLLCAAALLGVSVTTLTSCKKDEEKDEPPVVDVPEVKEYKATLKYNNGTADGSLTAVKDGESYYFEKPSDPTKEYNEFGGWYKDADCLNAYNFDDPVTANLTLYAKWTPAYDTVNTVWDFAACASTIKPNANGQIPLTEDMTFGSFILGAGARFEIDAANAAKNCVNTQKKLCQFVLSGDGTNNGFTMNAKWASSNNGTIKIVKKGVDGAPDEEIFSKACAKGDAAFDVTQSNLSAGTYAIEGDGSLRIYALSLSQKLPQGPTSGIELNTAGVQTEFLLGRSFDKTGLEVFLTYENGRKDLLVADNYEVSTPNMDTAGEKEVTITYHKDKNTTYTKSYKINVYKAESLKVYDYVLDSKRITKNLKTLYKVGEKLDTSCLAIKAVCKVDATNTIEFLLDASEYNLQDLDSAAVGSKSVTVTYGYDTTITSAINVEVINVPNLSAVGSVTVTVNPQADVSTEGTFNFHTISDALQFIQLAQVKDEALKNIQLQASTTYLEKVEINVPNVTLSTVFANANDANDTTKYAVIEFGALNGMLDPSETITHSTDGSATVSVRSNAKNFKALNVTFKNSFNTYELYQKSLTITSDSQAVALLCQADQAVFESCFFTSYHDTLYAQEGRQYYNNCTIEGHTDYIFGYDATAYFKGCTIRSIGAGADVTNGGYVVATKGNPSGKPTDANYQNIIYGYVFDGCTFTADNNTMAGSVSIARGWADGMAVVVMNSSLDNHFSKEAYGDTTSKLNDRYGKMNAAPVASQLLEYNNTGDGAITASIENTCTVLTEAEAQALGLIGDRVAVNVFTPYNGTTTYTTAWAPVTKDAVVVLKNSSDEVVVTLSNASYVGSYVTKAMLDDLFNVPEGYVLDGYFSDKACTTAFDYKTVLTAENTIYVKLTSTADVQYDVTHIAMPEDSLAWTTETQINDMFYVTTGKTEGLKNCAEGETIKYGTLEFGPKQISLTSGKATTTTNSIKLVLDKETKITIYCGQKADKTTNLVVLDANGTAVTLSDLTKNGTAVNAFDTLSITAEADMYEFTLAAGTYYIGGAGGGAYIYDIIASVKK